ncbi:MAG: ABC transporter ATP-binding protein [Synechococcus sp. SB0668_bin_15]|nr:ABC transporter ATP-binding protein [Synechococcus sp. SB0668_bin_15]MXZ83648.1 ABC transporter ATP-binding protein [Synechococcus sp. SB0666_bin_14]MYC49766.1 ABC transporter ATP-binding protein [Synechococcus sp. SB0662_bin_14]MYG47185.1 ABC transporter ATP-binding protein [Synechococcus sp. SB0675_bin_6]MYJ59108.1 ABC transporter ATP-binding protein [Synechococcus sp. SB0672_bin_6]
MDFNVQSVSKTFGEGRQARLVLKDINLRVRSGEFTAIVGRSGSGKSTLLRCLAGLEHPSRGLICMDGQPVTGPGPDRGLVFQNYSLYPWLNLAQNVAFGMELQGRFSRREIQERTAYFLDVVGLGDRRKLLPRQCSGGMQQRVAIARALAAGPKVLLLDEPFGALDLHIRATMQNFLYSLWERTRLTAILITHDLEEALLLAQQVHVLAPNPGRISHTFTTNFNHQDLDKLRFNSSFLQQRQNLAQAMESVEPVDPLTNHQPQRG